MHLNIALFPVERLVWIVSGLLESIIQINDTLTKDMTLTRFHSRAKPTISVYAYLLRVLKFTPFTNEALLSILVYFDRISVKHHYAINSLNAHRLLITSLVIASKFTSDVYYPMCRYATVGGLPLLELNQLELEFLFLCEFQLHVSLEHLQGYGNQLLHHAMNNTFTISLTAFGNQPSAALTPPPLTLNPEVAAFDVTGPISSNSSIRMRNKRKMYPSSLTRLPRKRSCPSPPYLDVDPRSKTADIDRLDRQTPSLH